MQVVSGTQYNPNPSHLGLMKALEQLDGVPNHCILVIDATVLGGQKQFEKQTVPLMFLTSKQVHEQRHTLSLCPTIIVIIEEPGAWVNWLPVEHKIIFITTDMGWIMNYPRLARLKKSVYYHISLEEKLAINLYERKPFSNDLTKVPFNKVKWLSAVEYENKLMLDFQGTELKAVGFSLSPFSVLKFDDPSGHDGYEVNIVSTIARALNLNMIINTPSTGGWWGAEGKNGNYTGT